MKGLMPGDLCRIIPSDTTGPYGATNCRLIRGYGICPCGCGIPDWIVAAYDGSKQIVSERVLMKIDPDEDAKFAEFWQDVKDEQTRPAGVPADWMHAHAGE